MTTQTFINLSAYGLKYYHTHADGQGTPVRLGIYQRGFSGTATEIGGLRALSLEVQGGNDDATAPIVKTSLSVVLADFPEYSGREGRKYGLWSEFYTPDSTLYLVTVERGISGSYVALWAGYITPDSWSEGLDTDGDIAITVRDNIGHLSDFPFDLAGDGNGLVSVLEVLQGAMTKIAFPMTLKYSTAAEGNAAALTDGSGTNIWAARVNVSQFEGDDWGHVLETVLGDLGLVLRYVGGSTYWAGPLRNLTLLGGTTTKAPSGDIALTFLGRNGVRQIDPAYKQIIEELAYETNSNLDLPVQAGLSGMATTPDYDWSYQMEIANPTAPGYDHINVITHGWNRTNTRGWTSSTAAFGNPAHYQIPEDSDALKDMALLVTNNDIRASYILDTHSPALRVTMTLKNGTSGVNTVETLRDGSFFNYFRLAKVTYAVAMHSNYGAAGDTVRYWNGYEWKTAETQLEQEFDTEQIAERVLDFTLAECADIPDGGQLEIIIIRADCVSYWTVWGSTQYYIYVPVSVLAVSSSLGVVSGDRVTTINDTQYNVTLDRRPDIGALSRDFGRIDNHTYENVLYRIDGNGMPQPWGYNAQWSDQSVALPFPVQMHLSLLCWHFTGMEVLEGDCIRADNGPWDFGAILAYKGARFLLVSGTLDLASGRMRSAIFHAFVEYIDTWGTSPDVDYKVKEGAAGNTSGTMGGYSGGAAAGGGGAAGTQYFEPHNDGIILKADYEYVSVPDVLLGEDEESLTSLLAIIAGNAAQGAAAYGYFNNGVLGTSHLPALYLGTTQIQTSSAAQAVTGVTTLTMSGKLTIGGAEIEWVPAVGTTPGYLKINSALLTDGDQIVGSGTPGGGGGGAGYLYELGDVYSVNNAVARADGTEKQVGDVLQYLDSTKGWVAVAASSIGRIYTAGTGLTISSSNVIGIASGYKLPTTTEWGNKADASALGNYLPLTGGTLTKDDTPLNLKGGSDSSRLAFYTSDGTFKSYVMYGFNRMYMTYGQKQIGLNASNAYYSNDNGTTQYVVYHSGNSNKSDVDWTAQNITAYYAHLGNGSSVTPLELFGSATGAAIGFYKSGTRVSLLYSSGDAPFQRLNGDWSVGYTIYDSGNLTKSVLTGLLDASGGYYLPLTGGNMTGTLRTLALVVRESASGNNYASIEFDNNAATTAYGVLKANSSNALLWRYSGADYTLYHSGNANKSDVAWACSTLTTNGSVTIYESSSHTYRWNLNFSGTTGRLYAINEAGTAYNNILINNTITVTSDFKVGIGTTSPSVQLHINTTSIGWASMIDSPNTQVALCHGGGYGIFAGSKQSSSSYYLLDLRYGQTTPGTGGTSALYVRTDGNVGIGTTSPAYKLDVAGTIASNSGVTITSSAWAPLNIVRTGIGSSLMGIDGNGLYIQNTLGSSSSYMYVQGGFGLKITGALQTTGDQVIFSDINLKTNLAPVTYSVEDIAKTRAVTFDWKDGRGHSAGSIAQDWKPLIPELVHGEEGNMTLAYGQIALVNTIIEAREIDVLKKRVAELEAEVQRLRS